MQIKYDDRKGYLKKLKDSSFNRIFGNTNLRWFELNFNDKTFGYKDDYNSMKLRKFLKFVEIKDFSEEVSLDDKKLCDWQYSFYIKTINNRSITLFCQTKTEHDNWTKGFNIVFDRLPKQNIPESIIKQFSPINIIKLELKAPKIEIKKVVKVKKIIKPIIIEEKPKKKRIIINENVTNNNLNSSNMLYDQNLSDFIDDVDKSMEIDESYLTSNNNKSFNSNNSQILVNCHKLDDWNFYNENGKKLKNETDNTNKELIEQRNNTKNKIHHRAKTITLENLHNNNEINTDKSNKKYTKNVEKLSEKEYNDKKSDFKQVEDFVADKYIMKHIAKANMSKPIDKANSIIARETLKQIENEEARKEKFNKYRIKSLLKKQQKKNEVSDSQNNSGNESFQEVMMENYMKNKNEDKKINFKIFGKNNDRISHSINLKEKSLNDKSRDGVDVKNDGLINNSKLKLDKFSKDKK